MLGDGAGDGTIFFLVVLGTISIDMGSRSVGRVTISTRRVHTIPYLLLRFVSSSWEGKEGRRKEGMAKEGQVGNYSSWHYFHFLFLFLLFFSCFFSSLSLSLSLPLSPSPCHTLVPHFPLVGSPSSGCRSHCLRKVGIFRAAVRSCFLFFLSFLLADLSRSCGVLWLTGGDEISIFFPLHSPTPTYILVPTHVGAYSSTYILLVPCSSTIHTFGRPEQTLLVVVVVL